MGCRGSKIKKMPRTVSHQQRICNRKDANDARMKAEKNYKKFMDDGKLLNEARCKRMLPQERISLIGYYKSFEEAMLAIGKLKIVAELYISSAEEITVTNSASDEYLLDSISIRADWKNTQDMIISMLANSLYGMEDKAFDASQYISPHYAILENFEVFLSRLNSPKPRKIHVELDSIEKGCVAAFKRAMK